MATTLERVQAGMEFLDDVRPGWRGEIDRDMLDLGGRKNCILGQLYGNYMDAMPILGLYGMRDRQAELGFELTARQLDSDWDRQEHYDDLTSVWEYLLDN